MDSIESIVWLTVSVEVILYHKIKTSQDNKKHNFEKALLLCYHWCLIWLEQMLLVLTHLKRKQFLFFIYTFLLNLSSISRIKFQISGAILLTSWILRITIDFRHWEEVFQAVNFTGYHLIRRKLHIHLPFPLLQRWLWLVDYYVT